jgi:hypothetical protein
MQLESLPNELLLNLFEWFDTVQLLNVFFGLNLRLNQLIYTHSRNHQFNLQSISKNDFDIICQQHLPLIIDQILSLHLSNEETPELTKLFLSRGFLVDQFICLKSLSLHCIYSLDTLIIITYQCSHLLYLTHLNIIKCDIRETQNSIADLFKNIWNIPKLLHCKLNIIELQNISLSRSFPVSSTIKYLFIENISCDLNCLFHLFKCTPYLQKFSTKIYSCFDNMSSTFIVPSITSLKIFCEGSIDLMKKIFSNMPNLYHLTIETFKKYLDGNAWKQIIIDYLPKIKIFQLKMRFKCSGNINNIEQIFNNLLTSFRSPFWIEERRWYVRCHWNRSGPYSWMTLYTLPYDFIHLII